jgi:hypothetical protein
MIERAPRSTTRLTLDEAWLYTITLTHDNKYDWRLPTAQEFNKFLCSAQEFNNVMVGNPPLWIHEHLVSNINHYKFPNKLACNTFPVRTKDD